MRDDEDLERIFTWQEERKLSKKLTLHYKRVTYLVEPGPETLPLAGERCRVHEHADGRIEVFHAGQRLPCGPRSLGRTALSPDRVVREAPDLGAR